MQAKEGKRFGIILVEDFTDRIRLHELNVLALAIMSNRITDEQSKRLADYANAYAGDGIN